MSNAKPRLVVCEQHSDYAMAASSIARDPRDIPIVGDPGRLSGFPAGLEISRFERQRFAAAPTDSPSPERWVVALDEPSCSVAGQVLARTTGRSLLPISAASHEHDFDRLLDSAEQPIASITFVVPLWSDTQVALDPRWVGRVLALVRARLERLERIPWGIITGADANALSLAVARAVLAPAIRLAYADAPAAMMINDKAHNIGSRLPPMPEAVGASDAALQIIDADHLAGRRALAIRERRWSMLYFRGHGRYYCGNEGFLCGARPLRVGPEQPARTCVDGLDCANPYDGAYRPGLQGFPRVDPRSYDAPILMLETCAAGGWSSPDWDAGRASLAILAFAGSASAVVSSDYTTTATAASHLDVFAALTGAKTIGEAVVRLNRARADGRSDCPQYLLGDPEFPLEFPRWASWCAEPRSLARSLGPAYQRIVAELASGSPFARVKLEIGGASVTTSYVAARSPDGEPTLASAQLVHGDDPELWLALDPQPGAEPIELVVETHLTPRMPPGLLEAAIMTPIWIRSWSDALADAVASMLAAAKQIEDVAELTTRVLGRAILSDNHELQLSVPRARQAWLRAHLGAVAETFKFVARGLWPFNLWRTTRRDRSSCVEPCPRCGAKPTQRLRYRSVPAIDREQWECTGCTLVEDRPLLPIPKVLLDLPDTIAPGELVTAQLRFINDSAQYFAVAGAVIVDRIKHGVEAPQPFVFELEPGETRDEAVTLRASSAPEIAHRYYARVPLLINGVWLLLTQQIAVHR